MYVQFDDAKNPKRPQLAASAYAQRLIQFGIVKTPAQAAYVLIVVAIAFMLGAYYIWQSAFGSVNPASSLTIEQLEQAGAPDEIAQ